MAEVKGFIYFKIMKTMIKASQIVYIKAVSVTNRTVYETFMKFLHILCAYGTNSSDVVNKVRSEQRSFTVRLFLKLLR